MIKIIPILALTLALSGAAKAQTAETVKVPFLSGINGSAKIEGVVYKNETFFVNAPDSPVQILGVEAIHIPKETAELAKEILRELRGNLHVRPFTEEKLKIKILAVGVEDVVAVKFGVVAHDSFKEYLGGFLAITMDEPKGYMEWDFRPAYLFKFEKYGVLSAYVRQVRLKSGRIWNYSPNTISEELSRKYGEVTREQIVNIDSK
jgi:hypothetical protein